MSPESTSWCLGVSDSCLLGFTGPISVESLRPPPNRPPVSAASMGVRWMIGVTEIDKGSAYGNMDSKQKHSD